MANGKYLNFNPLKVSDWRKYLAGCTYAHRKFAPCPEEKIMLDTILFTKLIICVLGE